MARGTLEIVSELAAPAAAVWQHAITMSGVSYELGPWLRMTVPPGARTLQFLPDVDAKIPLPLELGRSWLLLVGVLPVDYDDLRIVEIDPGRRFLERSTMATMRVWQHERLVETLGARDGAGCRVTDRLAWEPRVLTPASIAGAIVRAVFSHRHARLRARFGAVA